MRQLLTVLAARTFSSRVFARCGTGWRGMATTSNDGAIATALGGRRRAALIVGAGSGIGGAVARRFAREGLVACCVRRTDTEKLAALVADIRAAGGEAVALRCDATCEADVGALVRRVEAEVGPIEFALYNLGANVGSRPLASLTSRVYERAWQLGSLGPFLLARAVTPLLAERGHGTLIFTGATASVRGNAEQAAHAGAMFARRALAQSVAAEYGPQGVHVAHVVVDGMVDSPDTLGQFFPKAFAAAKAALEPVDGIVQPASIADAYWFLHTQPRHSWTFELDM